MLLRQKKNLVSRFIKDFVQFSISQRYRMDYISSMFYIEKSLVSYTKIFHLIAFLKKTKMDELKILFVGCPPILDSFCFANRILEKSLHSYVPEKNWQFGMLTKRRKCPDLVVAFMLKSRFSSNECFFKNIPLAVFCCEFSNSSLVDFRIVVDLKSIAAAKIYLHFLKQIVQG